MKRFAAIVGACGLVILIAQTASAQYGGGLTLSQTSAEPGALITVSGAGYAARTTVAVIFESRPVLLAETVTDGSGAFTAQVRIPTNATPGEHTMKARGEHRGGGIRVLTATITVLGKGMDRTARNIAVLLFALILAAGLVLVARGVLSSRG